MKKVALVALLALGPIPMHAEMWVAVGSLDDASTLTAVDTNTLVLSGGVRTAWTHLVVGTSDGYGFVDKVYSTRVSWKCDLQEEAIRQLVTYNATTVEVERSDTPTDPTFQSPIPGSSASALMHFVCAYDIAAKKPAGDHSLRKLDVDGIEPLVKFARGAFPLLEGAKRNERLGGAQ